MSPALLKRVLVFFTNRRQTFRIHSITSSYIILNTGSPQGCVLSALLYSMLTYDCSATFSSNHIVNIEDDIAVVGLISNNDETEYRAEIEQLKAWCRANNLCINAKRTKEMIVDFRRVIRSIPVPIYIGGTPVEVVPSFKYLGIYIDHDLTWHTNTMSIIKEAIS